MSAADPREEPGKKSLLVMLASFAGLTVVVVVISLIAGARARSPSARPPDAGPPNGRYDPAKSAERDAPAAEHAAAGYLGPLAQGALFGRYRIVRLDPITAARLRMEIAGGPGELYEIDARARLDRPMGAAETSYLTLRLHHDTSTAKRANGAEDAVRALAAALRAREDAGYLPPVLGPVAP